VLLVLTLAEATRQRKLLERAVADETRAQCAHRGRARGRARIQTATAARADLHGERPRIDIGASMVPRARPAATSTTTSCSTSAAFSSSSATSRQGTFRQHLHGSQQGAYKSATLRAQNTDIGLLMSAANAEVSRDNPQMLFVTAFAGILDLETGELEYCNAGHENPFLIDPSAADAPIDDGDGLRCASSATSPTKERAVRCARRAHLRRHRRRDGSDEPCGELYGSARVQRSCRLAGAAATARRPSNACVRRGCIRGGADPADDLTILAAALARAWQDELTVRRARSSDHGA
jgi:hypothetical protein